MTLRVVYKAPRTAPEVREVENSLPVLQDMVEGYLEAVSGFKGGLVCFCNEEGKLRGLQPNIIGPYDVIVGPVFLTKANKAGDLVSLTDKEVAMAMETLRGVSLPDRHAACPRCEKYLLPVGHIGALSRADNKTEVCSVCGTDEALVSFARKGKPQPVSEWPVELMFEEAALKANPGAELVSPVRVERTT